MREPSGEVPNGSALALALGWFEHLWETATGVRLPRFAVFDEVITRAGQDATVRSRRFAKGRWMYQVSAGGRVLHIDEGSLDERPTVDAPATWVRGEPAPADRFAATLTRAKLEKRFTDTVFSFRATRTIFLPYQFKRPRRAAGAGRESASFPLTDHPTGGQGDRRPRNRCYGAISSCRR
jgi:hypothetical protein